MIYEDIPILSCTEIDSYLKSGNFEKISIAILSASIYCSDEHKATEICLEHLKSAEEWVVRCSMIGLDHIARIYRNVNFDINRIENEIKGLGLEKTMEGTVNDLRRDIRVYILRHHGIQ